VTAPPLSADDAKPSPVGPVPAPEFAKPAPAAVEPSRPPVRSAAMQEVTIISSPAGATASLDGNSAVTCSTPCTLSASQGKHMLTVNAPAYLIERREILVGTGPLELAPVVLRAAGGTLMLTSEPKGAAVSVNGKRIDMVTPAQIPLALGTYTIAIEKDGRQASETVEIRNGINYRKITLGQ
jgi:hypothetical protein